MEANDLRSYLDGKSDVTALQHWYKLTTQMSKWSLKNKLLQLQISTCLRYTLCLIATIQFFAAFGKYNYAHIPQEMLLDELYKEVSPNLILKKKNPDCTYESILQNTESIENWQVPKKYDDFSANGIVNGSYTPDECNPLFSVAILVTYRNRQSQLDIFLPYIHNFLRKQKIHYKIFLIEQQDNKNWNKGILYNVGARHAMAEKFPCLILHDVDLLPLDAANLYACARRPRHMSASIDKFRYVLPYDYISGGVLAITADQYKLVDGFSNLYEGWGGEDDDFSARIEAHGLEIIRFPRRMSRYTMLVHRQEAKNAARERLLAGARARVHAPPAPRDGLHAPPYAAARLLHQRLFAQIAVHL